MNTEPSDEARSDPARSIILIGAALVALVVVTVVVVLLVGQRTATFPPGSPELAMQQYLQSFEDEDYEGAYAHFSAEVQEEMSVEEFEESAEYYDPGFGTSGTQRRVSVARVEETDDGARLHLLVEDFFDGGFGSSTYAYPREVRMIREDGEWRIDEPLVGIEPGPFRDFEEIPAIEPAP